MRMQIVQRAFPWLLFQMAMEERYFRSDIGSKFIVNIAKRSYPLFC